MRFLVALIVLAFLADSAAAERPSTLSMSCTGARALVAKRGAVVMSTGANTYQRFVASPGYCDAGEYAYTASAPTRDHQQCHLGYYCDTATPIWKDDDRNGLFGSW